MIKFRPNVFVILLFYLLFALFLGTKMKSRPRGAKSDHYSIYSRQHRRVVRKFFVLTDHYMGLILKFIERLSNILRTKLAFMFSQTLRTKES